MAWISGFQGPVLPAPLRVSLAGASGAGEGCTPSSLLGSFAMELVIHRVSQNELLAGSDQLCFK